MLYSGDGVYWHPEKGFTLEREGAIDYSSIGNKRVFGTRRLRMEHGLSDEIADALIEALESISRYTCIVLWYEDCDDAFVKEAYSRINSTGVK